MKTSSLPKYIIAFFALVKLLVPFLFIHSGFELHRDEFLYLADADHLAWGYIEMPPLLAFLGFLSKLMGGTPATVYLWGGITGAVSITLVGLMVLRLKGNAFAVFMACLAFLCSAFLRMHILFQPNFLDVLFWTWGSYLIVCWIQTDNKKYLYWLGVCFGLGMLGKYSMAFFIIGFLLAVALTDKRKWLLNRHFYIAMGIGVLICLPNLVWQYTHRFPALHHMELLTSQQLRFNNRTDFLKDQIFLAFPALVIWMGGLCYLLFYREGRKYSAILILYFIIIGLLLYFNGKGYYAAAIYPVLMAFGGLWFAQVSNGKYRKWMAWALPLLMLFVTYRILPLLLPYQSVEQLIHYYNTSPWGQTAGRTWEDHKEHPLPQDFADMLGWEEMAAKTAGIYHALPDSVKQTTMVYGNNYGEAGALNFYRKKYRLPEAYSDNASYVFWLPDQFNYKHFLFVSDGLPEPDDEFFNHWGRRQILDSVTSPYAREKGTLILLYSYPDDSARLLAEQHTLRDKRKFGIR